MYKNLLRPLAYLSIEHKLKWIIDWLYPFLLTILSVGMIIWLNQYGSVSLYSESGVINKIQGFIQGLPGFYIAALAAIATFNRIDIDKTMPAPAPTIDIHVQGKVVAVELTRRRFLCSMFAFLTAENIILIVMGIFAESSYLPIKNYVEIQYHQIISFSFICIYFMLFWQMILTSFWGLFYLGDKLHQPDA